MACVSLLEMLISFNPMVLYMQDCIHVSKRQTRPCHCTNLYTLASLHGVKVLTCTVSATSCWQLAQ